MKRPIQGVIFDFNGTLFLDNDKHVKAWSKISQELRGKPITEEELHTKMNGKTNVAIIDYLSEGKASPEEKEELSLRKEQYYRDFCKADTENFHLIKGAYDLFADLKKAGIPYTIASASIKPNIDFFVENFHLDDWMDPAKIVYDDGTYADKIGMFEQASRYLGVPLDQLTVIEDSLAGVNASVACRIPDIRIINSGGIKEQVENLDCVHQIVDDMSEIER